MSTSLLYHAWGMRGYRHRCTKFEAGQIIFVVEQTARKLRCPTCGNRQIIRRGRTVRRWRSLPIGPRPTFIEMAVQRISCRRCGATRRVSVDFAPPRRSFTKAFEQYVWALSRVMTILDIARHLRISWDVIKAIQKRYLKNHFARPSLRHVRRIAIDEIAVRKGHRYQTVVMDLDTGVVVFVGDGKGERSLRPFWRRLRRSGVQVEAVAIDMAPAYIAAVEQNLPQATIVFDHFHVVRLLGEVLTRLRRLVQRTAVGWGKQVIKGLRWILLKNPDHLDAARDEPRRLQEALELNKPLATGYYMKEELRQLWNEPNKVMAAQTLDGWIGRARTSGIWLLANFAKTLERHREGILAWFDHPISTGPLEGLNNKIKTMKRQAYGFRDLEFFKLKIMAIHQAKYSLIG